MDPSFLNFCQSSSTVEQESCNLKVAGSSPASGFHIRRIT